MEVFVHCAILCCRLFTTNGTGKGCLLGGLNSSLSVWTQLLEKAEDSRKPQILLLFVALPRVARTCLHLLVSSILAGEEIAVSLRTASPFYKKLSLARGPELRPREKALIAHPRVVLHDPGMSCRGSGTSELQCRAPAKVSPPSPGVCSRLGAAKQGFRISLVK